MAVRPAVLVSTAVASVAGGYALRGVVPYAAQAVAQIGLGSVLLATGRAPAVGGGLLVGGGVAALGAVLAPTLAEGATMGLPQGPFPVRPGFVFTLWTGGSLAAAWRAQRPTMLAIRPQVVMAHLQVGAGDGAAAVFHEIAAALPGVRVWVGVNPGTPAAGAQPPIDTATRFVEAVPGTEAVVWNPERLYKTTTAAARASVSRVAQAILFGWRQKYPGMAQGHTAYARPTSHSEYAWSAWCGGHDSSGTYDHGADFDLPQVYPVGEDAVGLIAPGLMGEYYRLYQASWGAAERAGTIRRGMPRGVYAPSAHVPTDAMVAAVARVPAVAFWPWHGSYDPAGIAAAQQLAAQWR